MGKILYPVGTEVQLRDWFVVSAKNRRNGNYTEGKRTVVDYIKGAKNPYVLSNFGYNNDRTPNSFSVDEIKRYRDLAKKTKTPEYPKVHPETYTKTEVDDLLKQLEDSFYKKLERQSEALERKIDDEVSEMHDHLVADANAISHEVLHSHTLSEDE